MPPRIWRRMIGKSGRRGSRAPKRNLQHKDHTGLVPEVTLVIVAVRESIPETGQQVVELHWPYGEMGGDSDVHAPTDDEIKCIVAGGGGSDTADAVVEDIAIKVGVRSAEQRLYERLKTMNTDLDGGADVVREKVALRAGSAARRADEATGRKHKVAGGASVTLEFPFDSEYSRPK